MISGRVQGVGFRYFTVQQAKKLGVTGWVKNLADGRVEAEVQGGEPDVAEMIDRLQKGPLRARVDHVEVKEKPSSRDPGVPSFKEFRIL